MTSPVAVIVGAGPGLGLSVARRWCREGYQAVLLGESLEWMEPLAETLIAEGFQAEGAAFDLLDPESVRAVISGVGERLGRIDLVHFNPSAWRAKDVLELTVPELLEDVAFGVGALLPAVQAAVPYFSDGARVLVTGSAAADTPSTMAPSLGVQKAAIRNLVTSLDATLADRGVRAVAVQINGVLAKEGPFSPEPIADFMWHAVHPTGEWQAQVGYHGEPAR
ncbi:SDR family oxidoreductase [Nocardioides sp. Bht2]|uniref:SDR family oxidoreductase n=1 Tax=Nocardioides sp. Bht2 TaxID=3392297 RepID=UPI0039B6210A